MATFFSMVKFVLFSFYCLSFLQCASFVTLEPADVEIQERRDAVRNLERKLLELQQVTFHLRMLLCNFLNSCQHAYVNIFPRFWLVDIPGYGSIG